MLLLLLGCGTDQTVVSDDVTVIWRQEQVECVDGVAGWSADEDALFVSWRMSGSVEAGDYLRWQGGATTDAGTNTVSVNCESDVYFLYALAE